MNALSMDPKPIEPHATATADRVAVSRTLRFTAGFPPGDYQIEVTVMDAEGTGRRRSATQWSDFSVVARGPASALCASTAAVVDTFCRASDGRFHPVRGVRHFEHAPSRG